MACRKIVHCWKTGYSISWEIRPEADIKDRRAANTGELSMGTRSCVFAWRASARTGWWCCVRNPGPLRCMWLSIEQTTRLSRDALLLQKPGLRTSVPTTRVMLSNALFHLIRTASIFFSESNGLVVNPNRARNQNLLAADLIPNLEPGSATSRARNAQLENRVFGSGRSSTKIRGLSSFPFVTQASSGCMSHAMCWEEGAIKDSLMLDWD